MRNAASPVVFALVGGLTLAACGPVSPELAADQCEERARATAGPTGEVGVGIGSGGEVSSKISIGISSDFLRGADPHQVYESCVREKTGEGPIRPLEL
ncbi:MAG: hypothetical protein GKR98_08695 [Boseongicola sp.]|nr:MAG: hypothetical protein GKR98_08695 [Boseongicola sp.]